MIQGHDEEQNLVKYPELFKKQKIKANRPIQNKKEKMCRSTTATRVTRMKVISWNKINETRMKKITCNGMGSNSE